MNIKETSIKFFLLVIIPTLIVAFILFVVEFDINPETPPYISIVGFFLLIGSGSYIYFTNMAKLKENQDSKEALKGYGLYMIPTITISIFLFIFVDPPQPPFLLVYGLTAFLIAYTGLYLIVMKIIIE
jgi:hypothetical protein